MRAGLAPRSMCWNRNISPIAVEMVITARAASRLAGCCEGESACGIGLMNGIEFQAPHRLNLRLF